MKKTTLAKIATGAAAIGVAVGWLIKPGKEDTSLNKQGQKLIKAIDIELQEDKNTLEEIKQLLQKELDKVNERIEKLG